MNIVSQAEIARRAEVSKVAITHQVKKGHLEVVEADGKKGIDLEDPRTAAYLEDTKHQRRNAGKQAAKKTGKSKSRSKPGRKPRDRKPKSAEPVDLEGDPEDADEGSGEDSWTYWDRRKTKAMTAKYELEVAIKRNDLVPREDLRRVFAKFYSVHASKLRPLGGKIAPDVAAALGIKDDSLIVAAQQVIDQDIIDALSDMQRTLNEYLASIGESEVEE